MKKILLATATSILLASNALAGSHSKVNIGIILGFTGPIESLTPDMASAAEYAISEVNAAGNFEFGEVSSVRADSTCIDAAAATAAAERLITADNVNAIVGGDCSGVTTAMLENVAMANGTVMISPSATSPALSSVEDDGLFFRTAPSDARQGQVITSILMDQGYKSIALTHSNSDYGKGLADSIESYYEAAGGTVTLTVTTIADQSATNAAAGAETNAETTDLNFSFLIKTFTKLDNTQKQKILQVLKNTTGLKITG